MTVLRAPVLASLVVVSLRIALGGSAPCQPGWNCRPRPLEVGEWLLMLRVQKTASKTVANVFELHVAGLRNVPVQSCWPPMETFQTVRLPTISNITESCKDPALCKSLLSLRYSPSSLRFGGHDELCPDPFDFYKVLKDAADGRFFVGSDTVPWKPMHKPIASSCMFAVAQHLSLPDVLQETIRVPRETIGPSDLADRRRLVVLLREPTNRTISEFKHVNAAAVIKKRTGVWEYDFNACLSHSYYKNDTSIDERLRCFLTSKEHAMGSANRQVKMLSGMPAAPELGLGSERSKERLAWENAALRVAKEVVAHAELLLISERVPESLAVIFHRLDWLPRLGAVATALSAIQARRGKAASAPTLKSLSWPELVAVGEAVSQSMTFLQSEDGQRVQPSEPLMAEVARRNQLDTALYEFAVAEFDKVIRCIRQQRGG